MEQKGLNRSLLGDFSDFVIVAVLILVVMEYTQWAISVGITVAIIGLNPCCNGIYSMRSTIKIITNK